MAFNWKNMLEGLDEGLEVVTEVASLVPGGQGVAASTAALDLVVENLKDQNPLNTASLILDSVVKSKTENVLIDNNKIIEFLEIIAKSTGNKADDKLVCIVRAYLECENENKTK